MREPAPGDTWFDRAFAALFLRFTALPDWLYPAVIGAVLLFLLTCLRGVFLLALQPRLHSLLLFLLALPIATAGGALAGLAYVLVRIPMRPLGVLGDLFTGVILTCVYLFGILIPAKYLFGDDTLSTRGDWLSTAIFGAIFGIIITISYWVNVRKRGTP